MLEPLVQEFQQSGARLAFYQTTAATGNLQGYSAVLTPSERNAVIVVVYARAQISGPRKARSGCAVTSRLQDGTFFSTTNLSPKFNKPPGFRVLRRRDAAPTELARRHQLALAESASPPVIIHDEEQTKNVLLEVKRRKFEWQVGRGVYVPLTDEEQARLGLPIADDS